MPIFSPEEPDNGFPLANTEWAFSFCKAAHCKIAIFAFRAKPCKHPARGFVDLRHQPDLMIPFRGVGLINAERVNPQYTVFFREAEVP
jgi:hypothetical protein